MTLHFFALLLGKIFRIKAANAVVERLENFWICTILPASYHIMDFQEEEENNNDIISNIRRANKVPCLTFHVFKPLTE